MKFIIYLVMTFLLLRGERLYGQDEEALIRSLFSEALTDTTARMNLRYLCKETKGRIPGSQAAAKAVEYTFRALKEAGADTVWLQKVPVPHWERGAESATVRSGSSPDVDLTISALGLSVGTGPQGIECGLIEVRSFGELAEIGRQSISGKIVFFNRPADPTLINTFASYGGAVDQRVNGASEAAAYGASAVIVRSATQAEHDFAHTGVLRYRDEVDRIPAVSVSPADANKLSEMLKKDPGLSVRLVSDCTNFPDTYSYNVVGQINGEELPGEYITVGGHLDAWDVGEGAHDDAGGCVQSIELIRLFKKVGIKPARSIRAVMFMNEEMSSTGGRVYAEEAQKRGEVHYAALESDRGVMSPVGFTFTAPEERLANLIEAGKYFQPYGISYFASGGGGSDIAPLGAMGTILIGYIPDTQRYFWFHHSGNDTFEQVNIREMQLGSAAIASLVFLIDHFNL